MSALQEAPDLGIPEVKPAIESIRGTWERKLSPQRRHAILQGRLLILLTNAFGELGDIGSEWRFYLLPPGEKPSSLVPDVAYVSYERMPEACGELREKPTIAPDVAVEVISPGDRRATLQRKIALYLANGSRLVIVVDPLKHRITFHESGGARSVSQVQGIAVPDAYPSMKIDLNALFAKI
jgi:Uma2 family endonuclease